MSARPALVRGCDSPSYLEKRLQQCRRLFCFYKLTNRLNVLSDLILVARKVQVTSGLIQNSARTRSHFQMCQAEHPNSWVTLEKTRQRERPVPSFWWSSSALLKSLPVFQRRCPAAAAKNREAFHMKKILQEVCRPIPPKCWMTLPVLLSGLSDRLSFFWIPRDTRTSSPCVIFLNVFSQHVIYSWMHHVSRHNNLQETLYEVLPRSSCGHCNIYGNMASRLHGSLGCSRSPALPQHGSHSSKCYKTPYIRGTGDCREVQRQGAAWSTPWRLLLWYII